MSAAGVRVSDLVVEFVHEGYRVRAVDSLTFDAQPGEILALLGPSGCGKTTTLSCLAGILTPTAGDVEVGGRTIASLSSDGITGFRQRQVGIVFQAFNLIPSLSARENVAMPLLAAGVRTRAALARADELLNLVGLADRAHHRPGQLSGGQQQRVAIARALVHDPPVLLADEPTANLDYVQSDAIINLLRDLRSQGRSIIISTHDDRIIPIADRVVRMLSDDVAPEDAPGVVEHEAGEMIFRQGTRGTVAFVIEDGEVEIVRELADGSERTLTTIRAGSYFGELAPLTGFARSASARARTAVTLRAYSIQEFRRRILEGDGADGVAPKKRSRAPTTRKRKTAPKKRRTSPPAKRKR